MALQVGLFVTIICSKGPGWSCRWFAITKPGLPDSAKVPSASVSKTWLGPWQFRGIVLIDFPAKQWSDCDTWGCSQSKTAIPQSEGFLQLSDGGTKYTLPFWSPACLPPAFSHVVLAKTWGWKASAAFLSLAKAYWSSPHESAPA